jgi:hypothetical protein
MDSIKKSIETEEAKKKNKGSVLISNNNNNSSQKEGEAGSEDKKSSSNSAQSSFDESSASTLSDSSEAPKGDESSGGGQEKVDVKDGGKLANETPDEVSELSDLFGSVQISSNSCTVCQSQTSKRNLHLSCHVSYLPKRSKTDL